MFIKLFQLQRKGLPWAIVDDYLVVRFRARSHSDPQE